eukprot:362270-Chlamydomonas_euryale.AAC.1
MAGSVHCKSVCSPPIVASTRVACPASTFLGWCNSVAERCLTGISKLIDLNHRVGKRAAGDAAGGPEGGGRRACRQEPPLAGADR